MFKVTFCFYCLYVAHGMSGDFLRLTQIVSTNIHKINQNGKQMFYLLICLYNESV